jgi:hypothetical protein
MALSITWEQLAAAFAVQAKFCQDYSPLYHAIFNHVAVVISHQIKGESLEFDEQALINVLKTGFEERAFSENQLEPTLLFTAALHAAVLSDAPEAAPLSRFYATVGGSYEPQFDRDVLIQMIGGICLNPPSVMMDILGTGRVQTNEVSRGVTWLLPAMVMAAWMKDDYGAERDLPITLVDLGCSAGLNLAADGQIWRWSATDGDRTLNASKGEPLLQQRIDFGKSETSVKTRLMPPGDQPRPVILKRLGYDLNPLQLDHPEDSVLLRALIWGDQPTRLERLDQAILAYRTLEPKPIIHSANIIDAVSTLHEQIAPGTKLLLLYNSTVTVYLDDKQYTALHRNIETMFRALPKGVRGVWVELESPRFGEPATPPKLCAIKAHTLTDRGDLEAQYLAYAEPHPQTVMLLKGWSDLRG